MMEKRNLTCINCPMGCSIEVTMDSENYIVKGNSCKRGADYAISEMTNPKRIVTTSVFVDGGVHPTVSVKTSSEIPKKLMFECVKMLSGIRVKAPVKIGQVIAGNVFNTGVDIVATRNVEKA